MNVQYALHCIQIAVSVMFMKIISFIYFFQKPELNRDLSFVQCVFRFIKFILFHY